MTDFSDDQINELLQSIQKSAGALGRIAERYGSETGGARRNSPSNNAPSAQDRARNIKQLNDQTSENIRRFRAMSESADGLVDGFRRFARGIPGGAFFDAFVQWGQSTVNTYREMTNVGQTFGGSMIQMSAAAAQAGLPLSQFASTIKNYSTTVAAVGVKPFFDAAKQVRMLSESSGLYGYTLDQLNGITGSYLELQRLQGNIQNRSTQQNAKAINEFAQTISTFSEITGKSRDAILETAQAALKDPLFVGQQIINTSQGFDRFNDTLTNVITSLAAQPGIAGDLLSKGFSQVVSLGSANLTKQGQEMISGGFGAGAALLDRFNQQLAAGVDKNQAEAELLSDLKKQLTDPAQVKFLQLQAAAGNEAAARMLELGENIKTFTAEQLKQAEADTKRRGSITTLFSSFSSVVDRIMGSFEDGILTPLAGFDTKLAQMMDSGSFKTLLGNVNLIGQSFGKLIASVFTPQNITAMAQFTANLISGTAKFLNTLFGVANFFDNFIKRITGGQAGLARALTWLTTAIVGATVFFKGRNFLQNLFGGGAVNIRAGRVNVYENGQGGGNIGQALQDIFQGKEKGSAPRGWRGRAASRFRNIAGVAEEAEEIGAPLARGGIRGLLGGGIRGLGGALRTGAAGLLSAEGIGSLLKGGLVGLIPTVAGGLINAGLDIAPDFKGKGTVQGAIGGASQGASIGAFVGTFLDPILGPFGTLLGGAVGGVAGGAIGAIAANWDGVKKALGDGMGAIGGFFGSVFKFFREDALKPLGFILGLTNPVGLFVELFTHFDDIKRIVSDIFSTFGNWFNGAVNWFSNLFHPNSPQAPGAPATPRTPASPNTAQQMTALGNSLQNQQGAARSNNTDLVNAVNGVKGAVDQQTVLHGRLLKQGNELQRTGNNNQKS